MKINIRLKDGRSLESRTEKRLVVLGRSPKCDVIITEDSLSRKHAQIEVIDDTLFIKDLGSANGVYIDGQRIPINQNTAFVSFSQIHLGSIECTIEHENCYVQSEEDYQYKSKYAAKHHQNIKESTTPVNPKGISTKSKTKTHTPNRHQIITAVIILFCSLMIYFKSTNKTITYSNVELVKKNASLSRHKSKQKQPSKAASVDGVTKFQDVLKKKSCISYADECRLLGLTPQDGDGMYYENNVLYIQVISTESIDNQPRTKEVEVTYRLLGSRLMERFSKNELDQIYLIVASNNQEIERHYRLGKKVREENVDIASLKEMLSVAIRKHETTKASEELLRIFN